MVSQQLMCAHSKKDGEFRIHVHAACLPTVAVQYKEHEDGEKVRTDAAQGVGGFVYSFFGGTWDISSDFSDGQMKFPSVSLTYISSVLSSVSLKLDDASILSVKPIGLAQLKMPAFYPEACLRLLWMHS